MKRKIAYILTTSALVMSAFLIGKTMSTQKIVEPKPNVNMIPSKTETTETETQDNICQLYDSSELTEDILVNRQGKLIIEKCVGKVTDDEKNGSLEDGSYISYENVDCIKGNTIVTYLIYNPNTNYTDDVIDRIDFVQKGE